MNPRLYRQINADVVSLIEMTPIKPDATDTLRALDPASVLDQTTPNIEGLDASLLPAVSVFEWKGEQRRLGDQNTLDQWFCVNVAICDKIGDVPQATTDANKGMYLVMRKALMDLFTPPAHAVRIHMPTAADVAWMEVRSDVVFDRRLPQYRHVVSGFEVWFRAFEQRPLGG